MNWTREYNQINGTNFKWFSSLLGYLVADFQSIKKPKGGPLETEKFFVEGG